METPKQEYGHIVLVLMAWFIAYIHVHAILFPMRDHKAIILQFKNNKKQLVIVIVIIY